ncbi:LysE family translocator [Idiomarina xiamenensis]|uniref:Amino acid transporter LysE n=1 Tax=Idiomarina xiamenensis 10-D-4 TaxID=740709 RepID=K2KSP2_9GAMM|nr:LysE family translocator [Idiomarina xiamenensis]EKE80620.1 amino acid transporter LysE [Idiomarina xiamenensis 10-D-4]
MDVFFSVLLFAFSTTITPGPNNVMIMSSGMNYGIRASLPHLHGICVGFPIMVLLVGVGFGVVFDHFPNLHQLIKVLGTAYLLWLAWHIARQHPSAIKRGEQRPLSFWQAALFQWVNGKAWIMASGAVATFTTMHGDLWIEVSAITLAFLLMAYPCVGAWLIGGSVLRRILTQPFWQRLFNISMGLLLALSVVPVIIDIWRYYFTPV